MATKKSLEDLQGIVNQLQNWIDKHKDAPLETLDEPADGEEEDGEGGGIDRPKDPPKNP